MRALSAVRLAKLHRTELLLDLANSRIDQRDHQVAVFNSTVHAIDTWEAGLEVGIHGEDSA